MTKKLGPIEYKDLDSGIRETVRWLRELGYNTFRSCGGDSNFKSATLGPDVLEYPHVFISSEMGTHLQDADDIWRKLNELGIVDEAHVEATYSPCDGHYIISVIGVNDEILNTAILKKTTGRVKGSC